MPWFPDSESGAFADVVEPLPTLLSAGNYPVPCTVDHAAVNIKVGPAIFDIVDQMVRDEVVGAEHRTAAAVIVASFMLPLLAREDRIAAYLGLDGFTSVVREMVTPHTFFENLGVRYVGPIDGHNIEVLEATLRSAAEWDGPVVVHALTEKGRGYEPATSDNLAICASTSP